MILALGFCLVGSASAIDVTVEDPSFEEATITSGSWAYVNFNAPPWICSSGTTNGAWMGRNYSNSRGYPQTGHNSLTYTEFNNLYVYQTLADTYVEGAEYTLSCWAVNHFNLSGTVTLSLTDGVNFADDNLALGSSGPQTVSTQSGFIWYEYNFTYTATAADAGKPIGIQFQGGGNTNFDDVTLEAIIPGVQVTPTLLSIDEEGPTFDTYDITLLKDPDDGVPGNNPDQVFVTVTPDIQSDVGAGAGTAITLTFTAKDIPQTVTVTAEDDDVHEDDHTSLITNSFSSVDLFFNGLVREVTAEVTDNELICGDWGYLPMDYDENCYVDLRDYAVFASYWMDETVY